MSVAARRSADAPWQLVAAIAILAGAFLRWYQLGIQIVLDDEWHALNKLLSAGVSDIATHFGYADYSIPLTLYYRFLLEHGGLTEWVLHVPMLAAGIGLLFAAPLLLRRSTSLAANAAWVALLAVSPLLVYHSRTARPYALTSLLTLVAIVGFRRWWLERSAWWGVAYVGTTFLAGWLHPTNLPFTLLPFVYYGARTFAGALARRELRQAWSGLRRLLVLGTVTLVLLAAALVPPAHYDWEVLKARAGLSSVGIESLYRTALMLFGVSQPAALAAVALLAGYGAVRRGARDRDELGYLGTVIVGGAVTVVLPGSLNIDHPLVLARYLLPALPFLLLFVAEGTVGCLERIPQQSLRAATVTLLAALLWWLGPMPQYLYYPNQFMGHLRFQYDYDQAHNPYVQQIPRDPIPEFYRGLAQKAPGSLTLIEAPWRLESDYNPHPWYQEVHRQKVMIGLVTPVCGIRDLYGEYPATIRGMRLHEFAHLSGILGGKTYGADYLVLHLAPWKAPEDRIGWPNMTSCLPAIEARLGVPVYRDGQIVVFDLRKK
jgi:hypothetical protein